MFSRPPSATGRKTHAPTLLPAQDKAADGRADWTPLLARAELARCCSARPTIVAVFPPRHGRSRAVDLLLCGHHYRAARAGMAEAGAEFYSLPPS
jgi:hypothetical protein